jgi:hypothetical protein
LVLGFRKDEIQERLVMVFGDFAMATRPVAHIRTVDLEMAGNRGLRHANMVRQFAQTLCQHTTPHS